MASGLTDSLGALRCPLSGEPLHLLAAAELAVLRDELAAGSWLHSDGSEVSSPLTAALRAETSPIVYRVEDEIACLMPSLAIQPAAKAAGMSLPEEKRQVQEFYDSFGWLKAADGVFNDTAVFTDRRTRARAYQLRCNERIGRHLDRGRFLLDVASGPIPHSEYLEFSRNYERRVCVDFSIRALREARSRLGDRGVYILGDITCLPLADNAMDAIISLHTVYHLARGEQARAIAELHRVARPGAPIVVVYVWSTSPLMNFFSAVRRLARGLKRTSTIGRRAVPAPTAPAQESAVPSLFFCPQDYSWYRSEIAPRFPGRLAVWSAVSSEFQSRFFSDSALGRVLSRLIPLCEDALPGWCGRFGQYPMFLFKKQGS